MSHPLSDAAAAILSGRARTRHWLAVIIAAALAGIALQLTIDVALPALARAQLEASQ